MNMEWQEQANCRGTDTEAYYHAPDTRRRVRLHEVAMAKRVCERCIVKDICYDFALQNGEEYGVWGGEDFDAGESERFQELDEPIYRDDVLAS